MKKILLLLFTFNSLYSQINSGSSIDIFKINFDSYANSIGGKAITLENNSRQNNSYNPASSTLASNTIYSNYSRYVGNLNLFNISYVHNPFENLGNFNYEFNYLNYGSFTQTDKFSNEIGEFSAYSFSLGISYSQNFKNRLNLGLKFKPYYTRIHNESAHGLCFDFGALYRYNSQLKFSALIRNMGTELKELNPEVKTEINSEILIGFAYKLEHAPVELNIDYQDLANFDTYIYKNEKITKDSNLAQKILSHLIIGAQLKPSESFYLNLGFNFKNANQLNSEIFNSYSGLSWGAGIEFEKISIFYSGVKFNNSTTLNLGLNFKI